jgi:hypothetical protein
LSPGQWKFVTEKWHAAQAGGATVTLSNLEDELIPQQEADQAEDEDDDADPSEVGCGLLLGRKLPQWKSIANRCMQMQLRTL